MAKHRDKGDRQEAEETKRKQDQAAASPGPKSGKQAKPPAGAKPKPTTDVHLEAPPAKAAGDKAGADKPAPRRAKPTVMGPRTGRSTMLQPNPGPAEEQPAPAPAEDRPASRRAKPTVIGPKAARPTMLQPEQGPLEETPAPPAAAKKAKPTPVAPKKSVPTMLRPADESATADAPGVHAAKPTAPPPVPVIPNLSLDETKPASADGDVAEAEPASGLHLGAAELVDAQVIEPHEPEIVDAEPVSGIRHAGEVVDADVLGDEVIADAEPVSGVQSPSGVMEADILAESDDEALDVLSSEQVAERHADEPPASSDEPSAIRLGDVPVADAPPSDVALPDLSDELPLPKGSQAYGLVESGGESGIFNELQRQSQDDFMFSDTPPPGKVAEQADVEKHGQDLLPAADNLQLADELEAAGFVEEPAEAAEVSDDENVFAGEDEATDAEPVSSQSNLQFAEMAAEIAEESPEQADADQLAADLLSAEETSDDKVEEADDIDTSSGFDFVDDDAAEEIVAGELDADAEVAEAESPSGFDLGAAALAEAEEHADEDVVEAEDELVEADAEVLGDEDVAEELSSSDLDLVEDEVADDEELVAAEDEEEVVEEVLDDEEVVDAVSPSGLDLIEDEAAEEVLDDEEVVDAVSPSGLDLVEDEAAEEVLDDEAVVDAVSPSGLDLVEDEVAEEVLGEEEVAEEVSPSGLDLVEDEPTEDVLDDEEVVDAVSPSGLDLIEDEVAEEGVLDDEEVVDAVSPSGLDLVEDAVDEEELLSDEEEAADLLADQDEAIEAAESDEVVDEDAASDLLADEEALVEDAESEDLVAEEADEDAAADLLADEELVEDAESDDLVAEEADEDAAADLLADEEAVAEDAEESAGVGDVLFEDDEAAVAEEPVDEELIDAVDEEVEEEAIAEAEDEEEEAAIADEEDLLAPSEDLLDEEVADVAEEDEDLLADEAAVDEGSSAISLGDEEADDKPSGIDSIAEELESGLALGKARAFEEDIDLSDVEDDGSSAVDLGSLPSQVKKGKKKDSDIFGADDEAAEMLDDAEPAEADEEAAEMLEGMDDEAVAEEALDDEEVVADEEALDEDAAAGLLEGMDDEEVVADDEAVVDEEPAFEADEEAVAEADEELVEAAAPGKKRRAPAYEEEEERGPKRKPRKPKYARRWAGGFMLATIAMLGTAVGFWYFDPDQLGKWMNELPASPNAKSGFFSANRPISLTPLQVARDHMNKGEFPKAIDVLKSSTDVEALAARGEARWFQYLKQQSDNKLPLDGNDEQVKLALTDVQNKPLLKKQIDETLNYAALMQKVNTLQGSEKIALGLLDTLVKAGMMPNASEVKDLPPALDKTLADKKIAEQTIDQFKKSLVDGKVIDMKDVLDAPRFQAVVTTLNSMKQLIDTLQQKLLAANIKETPEKGLDQLLTEKKVAEDKLNGLNKAIADAGAKDVRDLTDMRDKLLKERDELDGLVKVAFAELKAGKFVADNADPRKSLVDGLKSARSKAESPIVIPLSQVVAALGSFGSGTGELITRGFDMTAATAELGFYRVREPFVQTPENKLDVWAKLLDSRDFTAAQDLGSATRDADYVRSAQSKASADVRAKALYIQALALRNQEKFADAKDKLKASLDEAANVKSTSAWTKSASSALAELSDPGSYYLPRIAKFEAARDYKQALQEADLALRVIPDNAALLARRSLLRLEVASAQGEVMQETQQQIRADALAAQKDMAAAAEGHYALGRLEETLDNLNEAEKEYRAALAVHKGTANEASRYRIALTRLLLRDPARRPNIPANPEDAAPKKLSRAESGDDQDNAATTLSVQTLLALALTGVQFELEDENPLAAKRVKESIQLANELIMSDDPKIQGQGYMLLGQAHSLLGERTKGLKEFIKGLQLVFPGRETKDLMTMVDQHPAFRQPDTLVRPNPYLAETQFGKGLHYYWSEDYPKAEEHFRAAIGYFAQDARYYYFLGLSQHQQKSKTKQDDADFALQRGAVLEAENRPPSSEINASLERIQGDLRQFVNGYRQRGLQP